MYECSAVAAAWGVAPPRDEQGCTTSGIPANGQERRRLAATRPPTRPTVASQPFDVAHGMDLPRDATGLSASGESPPTRGHVLAINHFLVASPRALTDHLFDCRTRLFGSMGRRSGELLSRLRTTPITVTSFDGSCAILGASRANLDDESGSPEMLPTDQMQSDSTMQHRRVVREHGTRLLAGQLTGIARRSSRWSPSPNLGVSTTNLGASSNIFLIGYQGFCWKVRYSNTRNTI